MKFNVGKKGGASIGKDNFIKLKDGGSIMGVFTGDIHEYYQHWTGSGSTLCDEINCELCAKGNYKQFRFRVNFITKENGAMVAKVFEQGWKVYKQMSMLDKKYNLDTMTIEIMRSGIGKDDTVYTIIPTPDGRLSEQAMKAVKAIKLHSFVTKEEEVEEEPFGEIVDEDYPPMDESEEIPF